MNTAIEQLSKQYQILQTINLDEFEYSDTGYAPWIRQRLHQIHRDAYENNQRILFTITQDYYQKDQVAGLKLQALQRQLNDVDISNYFCIIISTNSELNEELYALASADPVPLMGYYIQGSYARDKIERKQRNIVGKYSYGSSDLAYDDINKFTEKEQFLLKESRTFCMVPWIHLHAYPTGEAYPCCGADMDAGPLASTREHTLKEIWNGEGMRKLRRDMLSETWNPYCVRCYEQENSGFVSMRNSSNKHSGHLIERVAETHEDGRFDRFELVYWDIRFSNLCNLRCRSCGYIFSSQWHSDQVKLMGERGAEWAKKTQVLNYAGRTATDMWEQLEPHLDYVEQIYFAGGEPLMMEEHYNILDELERRGRWDVRLIYNTNFTHFKLKDRVVFDYWRKFNNISVGASLDGSGAYAEYIRKGTDWAVVEENRRLMMDMCPQVDFYVSATMSIFNALHLPDFHRDWVARGLITAQDFHVNILQNPAHYRIDIATRELKEKISKKFEQHLDWLSPIDHLKRATQGFESATTFLNSTDNSHLIPVFWEKTNQLDAIRNENILDIIPELSILK